jgi:DNA-binding MarR family transcriptional regulator
MTQPRWLSEEEERAWRRYRRMRALLDLQISRDLGRDGLSAPDYDVLSTLSEAEGDRWRVTEFARRLLWDQSRLSHHLSRMEKRGLVTREDCTHDGRGAFVILTDAGRRALEAAAPHHVASVRAQFIDLLTPDQLATLDAIAEVVIDHLGDEAQDDRARVPRDQSERTLGDDEKQRSRTSLRS